LAGEATDDDIGGGKLCGANVIEYGHSRPMLRQYAAAKRFDFAEGDGLHPSPFKAERKAANA
jgi:hypothetical protein